MARPSSFKPLKKITKPGGGIHLERDDGTTFRVTEVATDENDGITDADFTFDQGARWADTQRKQSKR